MMVKTLVALYKDPLTAQRVVEALLETGFSGEDISLLVKDSKMRSGTSAVISPADGAGLGALVGALVGIGSILVPGIGAMLGGSPLVVAVTAGIGAAAGALTGGISASLLDLNSGEEASQYYWDSLRGGGTAVSVTSNEEWLEWAAKIMARHEPLKMEEREAHWYGSGWKETAQNPPVAVREAADSSLLSLIATPDRPPNSSSSTIKRVKRVQIYDN